MSKQAPQLEQLDQRRRSAYLWTAYSLGAFQMLAIIIDFSLEKWLDLPSSIIAFSICLIVCLGLTRWNFATQTINNIVSLASGFSFLVECLPFIHRSYVTPAQNLSFILVSALWFGFLPRHRAVVLSLVAYILFSILVTTRSNHDLVIHIYLGGVTIVVGMVASFGRQVSLQQEKIAKYQYLAQTDTLTSLLNRRAILNELEELWELASLKGQSFSLFMLDIDYFKNINDQYGHTAGDEVLKEFGAVLLEKFNNQSSYIARWGGEEFMLLFANTNKDTSYELAQQLHDKTFTVNISTHPQPLEVGFSVGASLSDEALNLDDLLRLTDQRLHAAKENGRSQVKWDLVVEITQNSLVDQKLDNQLGNNLETSLNNRSDNLDLADLSKVPQL